jgi:hypothetical protein
MAGEPSSTRANPTGKRPYHPPQLEEYGDIREVTQSVSMTGAHDGAVHGSTRTG